MTHTYTFLKKNTFIIICAFLFLSSIEKSYSKQLKSSSLGYDAYGEILPKKNSITHNLKELNTIVRNKKNAQKEIIEKSVTKNSIDSISTQQSSLILNPIKKIIIELSKETLQDLIISKNKANLFSCIPTVPTSC